MKLDTKKPTVNDVRYDSDGNAYITFKVTRRDIIELFKWLDGKKDKLVINIKEFFNKRSVKANNYFWELCGKLAEVLTTKDTFYSAEDIYRGYILQMNVFRDVTIMDEAVDTLIHSWSLHGTGWQSKLIDEADIEGFSIVRLYYGSSTFNTKQMARLINMVIADCKEQGIETLPPDELAKMLSAWKGGADEKHTAK